MVVNFLKETLDKMIENGISPNDVLYVFNSFGYCSWEEFEKLANFDYNNGYGLAAIDLNLTVRGSDWWLERGEYDGSEWWKFCTMPLRSVQRHDSNISLLQKYFNDEDEDEE